MKNLLKCRFKWKQLLDYPMYSKKELFSSCFAVYCLSMAHSWDYPPFLKMPKEEGCYQILVRKGQEAFSKGNYEDAYRKFSAARGCPDKPVQNNLAQLIHLAEQKLQSLKYVAHHSKQENASPANTTPLKEQHQQEIAQLRTEIERIHLRVQQLENAQTQNIFQAEAQAWDIAHEIDNEVALNKFLQKYPNGYFSKIAHQQLEWLKMRQNLEVSSKKMLVLSAEALVKSLELVEVSGKSFSLGNDPSMQTIDIDNFYISRYEISESQWFAVMGNYPQGGNVGHCPNCPIRMVSWNDVQHFILKLNQLTGKNYRLPSEAEWEWAAKGDSDAHYAGGNDLSALGWFGDNAQGNVHPVGQKSANELGLYDMTGNVREWCMDIYDEKKTSKRIFRGGSWADAAAQCTTTLRAYEQPNFRDERTGFRLAMSKN